MKNRYYFLILMLALSVLSCTLPKEIEIRGTTPELTFRADMDFSEMFPSDMIQEAFSGENSDITVLDCVDAVDHQTYLLHMEAIKVESPLLFELPLVGSNSITIELPNGEDLTIIIEDYLGHEIKLLEEAVLYNSKDGEDPVILPLEELGDSMAEFLGDFYFTSDVQAKIYFSSQDRSILEIMNFDIHFGDTVVPITNFEPVNFDVNTGVYIGTVMPSGGNVIEGFASLLNQKQDIEVNVKIYMEEGTSIEGEWLNKDIDITAELVIWLPLELQARAGGATIDFPSDFFEGVDDFIDTLTDIVESLSLIVGMSPHNPFKGGNLIMEISPGFEIVNRLDDDWLKFAISEDEMQRINNLNSGFNPKFSLRFAPGQILGIPKGFEFSLTSITLEATRIKYTIEL